MIAEAEAAFLAIASGDCHVGIEAGRVRRIEWERDWRGDPPLDLAALIPSLVGEGAARVLVVELARGDDLLLRTSADVAVRRVGTGAVLRLPLVVRRQARFITGLVIDRDSRTPPLLLLDPDQLRGAAEAGSAWPPTRSLSELW